MIRDKDAKRYIYKAQPSVDADRLEVILAAIRERGRNIINPRRRFTAVRILETLDDGRIEAALQSALQDPDSDIREVARLALGHRKGEWPYLLG